MKFILSFFIFSVLSIKFLSAQNPVVTNIAILKTSLGDIKIEFYGEDAPKTVANFLGLAKQGFYDGILFHRVVSGFVIQAGDPQTKDSTLKDLWGTGGESIYGSEFEDELNAKSPSYKRGYVEGVVAMANAGPNTNTSQFFIGFGKAINLPKKYTIYGKVIMGLDIVHTIEKVKVDANSRPLIPVVIISVKEEVSGLDIEDVNSRIDCLELK
ncbi:MAG: peptidylprolyl isomerase [Chlorobiota bacterium]|jgi:peptidylprolyl isomerase domain and WD repeat-containing protein 1|nr:peptidylprolyl isomerase [Chlorobiota bacterium]QQS67134.1 MAG: peptidylprolyl isomerase [Chlorobiota bacterium]